MRKLFNYLIPALFLLLGISAYAVPARSVVREYTQPDGTTVSLKLVGDEFSHFYLTDDGEMVVSAQDGYYFAVADATGMPVASKVLASDPSKRTAEATRLLSAVKKADLFAGAAKRREVRAKARPNNGMKAAAQAASANWPSGIGLFPNNTFPVTGSPNVAIILVQFKDQSFKLPDPKSYFTGLLSKEGFSESGLVGGTNASYNAHGSALDYFKAASNGQFTPNFQLLGPVTLPNNMSYYGGNDSNGDDKNPHLMVLHAVQALDATVDFSQFDNDNDGIIDNVYVVYCGLGEANGGAADTVWPHSWSVVSGTGQYNRFDGKILNSYACSAEVFAQSGSLTLADGIGTFCHEFSHVMGLPDLYQTNYDNAVTPLTPHSYSLMDYGSYSNNSRTPPTYSVYERNAMGWVDIEVLGEGEGKAGKLEHMLTSNKGYAIRAGSDNEFFLLENRQLSDWDEYLPGHGMLVWHINYDATTWNSNAVNNATKQYVDIVEAGGKADNTSATTLKQYPFPGTKNVTSFTSSTTPALKTWASKAIDVPLTNIKENADGTVTFDICGGVALEAPECNYTDSPVVSDSPVTVTLTKPSTAPATATINYIWMYNDASDLDEGVYTSPITFTKSGQLEYWMEDGDVKSQVKTLKIYVGEEPAVPTEYTIIYKDSTTDGSSALTSNTYASCVEEGAEIASFSKCTYVYDGITGIKFSSSSKNGTITLNLAADYQLPYKQVIVKAKQFKDSEDATIKVDNLTAQSVGADLADYTFDLDGSVMTSITLTASKRLYVKSITFVAEGQGGGEDPVEKETVATPTFSVEAGEVEKGTAVELLCSTEGASIFYTLDGTEPTTESTLYTEGIVVNEDVTIKAIAALEGWNDSEIASAAYTVKVSGGEDPVEPGEEVKYTIVYVDSSADATSDLTSSTYGSAVDSGSEIAAFKECSKVYNGIHGVKFSSSKVDGHLTLNLNSDYQLAYDKVIVKAVRYGSDDAAIKVGNLAAQSVGADLADYTFDLDGSVMTSITLTATKRLYVKSITFVAEGQGGGEDPVEKETVATPTFSVEAGEVEQGTVVEILCATEDATIHFTVDGTEPTSESDVYTDAIVIEEDMTIKAIAVKEGWNDSEVATVAYTVKPNEGGDDPIVDGSTVNFDFNSDNGYGMTLMSGTDSGFNEDGYKCVEGPITLTLHGNTRWWNSTKDGNHLRLYSGAYITVSCPDNHDIQSVHLTVGNESHWENTTHVSKVPSVDFNTTHSSGNTILHKVEVNYIATTSIVDVDAEADGEAVYYNLQGIRVNNPESGLYIRVQGNKVTKVMK